MLFGLIGLLMFIFKLVTGVPKWNLPAQNGHGYDQFINDEIKMCASCDMKM